MGKFDLNKGDRFKLDKSSGLSKIQVELGWKGGVDLDASTFLLGEDGVILRDEDFVYFKSENRSKPFDRNEYGNKKKWREETRPMSFDGAVLGSIDETGDDADESDASNETIDVDLDSVDGKITEIVFLVTIYNREEETGITFKEVIDPYIKIIDADNGSDILQYKLSENFASETGVVVGKLNCNIDGEWEFEAIGKGYDGGLQTFVDMFT